MQLFVRQMDEAMATDILDWQYDKPYDFYNNEQTEDAMNEILDGSYYTIVDGSNALIGFFCMGADAKVPAGNQFGVYDEDLVDMGVGMNPNLVGKGNGFEFCTYVIQFIRQQPNNPSIRLTVATFNERAIHLYKKLGFVAEKNFSTGSTAFMTMVKKD